MILNSFHKQLYEKWFDKYKVYKVIDKGSHYIDDYKIYCNDDVYVSSKNNTRLLVNYHLVLSNGVMEISTSESDKIAGRCQIKGKIEEKKSKSKFKSLLEDIISWFKG